MKCIDRQIKYPLTWIGLTGDESMVHTELSEEARGA